MKKTREERSKDRDVRGQLKSIRMLNSQKSSRRVDTARKPRRKLGRGSAREVTRFPIDSRLWEGKKKGGLRGDQARENNHRRKKNRKLAAEKAKGKGVESTEN